MQIDKWKLFETLGYKTYHTEVTRFHESKAQTKVCCAPARTTKSYCSSHDVLPDIFRAFYTREGKEFRVWVVGPSYSLAEKEFRYIHEALVIKGRRLGIPKPLVCLTNPRSGQLYMHFQYRNPETGDIQWNCYIEGKTADRPESLLGEAVDIVIYSEAAQLPRGIRERYVRPRLITRRGREIVPTTPDAKGEWVHELFLIGQTNDFPEIESFTWDRSANPDYDDSEFQWAKRFYGANSPIFREQYLGEWVFYGGMVYPSFDPSLHVIQPFKIPPEWPRIRGIDFGHRDPFVCLWCAVGPHNELYFYREYYCREGRSLREHATKLKALSSGERINRTVGDPSEKQAIEDLCYDGISCDSANNDRTAGRLRVMEYLTPTDDGPPPYGLQDYTNQKWPRYYIFNTLPETIREYRYYRWKEGKQFENEKEKTEGDDHAHDVTRYICMTRPSPFRNKIRLPSGSFSSIMNKIKSNKFMNSYLR
jgi:hypothetical protein